MALQKSYIFQNTGWAMEDLKDPNGNVVGKTLILYDRDTGEIYRYPTDKEASTSIGKAYLGIEKLSLANGRVEAELAKLTKKPGGRK